MVGSEGQHMTSGLRGRTSTWAHGTAVTPIPTDTPVAPGTIRVGACMIATTTITFPLALCAAVVDAKGRFPRNPLAASLGLPVGVPVGVPTVPLRA